MMKFWDLTKHFRGADAYTLIPHAGHLLWETTQMPHCSCPAAWREYQRALDGIPMEDWLRDATGTMLLWFDCTGWQVFQDAADRLYFYLRQRDIPTNGATLSAPVVQRRTLETETPFMRAKAPLCVYVRIDFDGNGCFLEFEAGEDVELKSGAIVLASGFRRHRIRGAGHFLHFQVQLPVLARPEAMQTRSLHDAAVLDSTVFAAATAQPLNEPLPPPSVLMEKIEWLHARWRRGHRHKECPAVLKFLVNNGDPNTATAEELNLIRRHSSNRMNETTTVADDSKVLESIPVLNISQCLAMRRFAEDRMTSVVPDTVDDLPEYQVNLSLPLLEELLGHDTAQQLWNLPERLGSAAMQFEKCQNYDRQVEVFLRMYSPDMRPYISFHTDNCSITANVALNDDSEFVGGRLLAITDNELRIIPREIGAAFVHCSQLVHGVSRIESGVRYTLILFYHMTAAAISTTM